MTPTVLPLETFRNQRPYPFCPGCGHGPILDRLDEALVRLGVDPALTVIVTDIGCSGLSDQYFTTGAFHGLHGRSITYATGIKLANPELTVIVVMGDGGTGIGGAHLLSAARRNIGITVLVMNNLNFGMTGGQHSTTTPEDARTSTTPRGNLEHPLDICATVGVNGAGYVYRGTSFDDDLADRFVEAISHPGFALLDVWELCTAYFVRANQFSRRGIEQTMDSLGFARGVLYQHEVAGYIADYVVARSGVSGAPLRVAPRPIPIEHDHRLDRPAALMLAGSAGGKVQSAARLIANAAIRSGLWVTQEDDYPVTVRSGHSVVQLTMAPTPQPLLPVGSPDALVLLSADGLAKTRPILRRMDRDALVVTTPEFPDVETNARVVVLDPKNAPERIGKATLAAAMAIAALDRLEWFDIAALDGAARATAPYTEENVKAVRAGLALSRLPSLDSSE
jgi:pyruvate/2-oxoacid:ferredoxin oxidoreductase beta subunit/Pyruvate/2-oxoacid:ferredoxin oxidoreductase gamma subunit